MESFAATAVQRKVIGIHSVFVTIEEGDTLILPFPYTLTISGGVIFK